MKDRLRRVACRRCGVRVEKLPWAEGKLRLSNSLRIFLAQWARLLSWREVGNRFAVGWDAVYDSVSWVVAYGLEHRVLGSIEAIGVDEIHVKRRGKVFWTLVYQIDAGARRLLWIGEDRTKATFHPFFDEMGPEVCASIRFVCTDMWKAYLSVVAERLGDRAVHVIDCFHVVKRLLEALDEMRRKERSAMAQAGAPPLLKNMRWAFLKRRSPTVSLLRRHFCLMLAIVLSRQGGQRQSLISRSRGSTSI